MEASAAKVDRAAALAAASRCRALLLAEHGDAEAASDAIEQALQQHDRVLMPIERARTLVKGQLERRASRWHAAQESASAPAPSSAPNEQRHRDRETPDSFSPPPA